MVELRGSEEMEEMRKWRSTGVSLAAEGLPADGMACYTRCDLEEAALILFPLHSRYTPRL
jgi:hypothetical protein